MKKLIVLYFLSILSNYLIAQDDVIYTLQALLKTEAVQIDSILIENESNGKMMIFKDLPQASAYKVNISKGLIEAAPSVVTQMNLTVIDKKFSVAQNYNGNLALNFNGITSESVLISVYNIAGMLEYSNFITVQPTTSLKLELPGNSVHIVSIKSGTISQAFKAIGSSSIAQIKTNVIAGLQASAFQNTTNTLKRVVVNVSEDDSLGIFNFTQGDRLSIMVYKSNMIATPITKLLYQNENLNFELLTLDEVYVDANIKTEIPVEDGSTIDLSGYSLSFGNKTTSIINSGSPSGVKSFGRQKIVKHENGALTSEAQGNIQLTKKGGMQYVSLKNAGGNDIMFTTIDLSKVNNPAALDISSINIESTALATLCMHPYFITSSAKVMETLKSQFKQLPSFNIYRNNLNTKLIAAFKTPQCSSIDYSTIEGYANVIFDYLMAYKVEDNRMKGFVEPVFNEWDGSSNVSYRIVNKGKRTIVVYANQQVLDGSVLAETDPITQTENIDNQSKEEPALFLLLEPGKLDYWSTVTGSFWGYINEDMPDYIFKSESGDINVDLGNANRLELEVWGMGKLHKPISAFTTDEKYKLTYSVILSVLNDFITPGFELVSEIKGSVEPIASGNFDFRYGNRNKALFELAKKLAEAYLTDPGNWVKIYTAIESEDYVSIIKDIPGFIAEEIYSDIDKPQNQTKYLNLIYNAYKNLIGESKQSDFVRGFIKNAYNSTFRNFSIANRTVSLLEKIGDFAGSFYYVFADGVYTKSTFTKDFKRVKVTPTQLQLMPGEKKKVSVCDGTSNISVNVTDPNTVSTVILSETPTDPKVLKEIEVTGVSIGKTKLTITDLTNNSKVSLPILVQNQCYTDLDLSTTNLVMGISQNATVKITGGSSKYSIKNTTTQSAVAVIKDNSIIIHARAAGVAQILVKDELSEQTKTITVNVFYFAGLNPSKGLVAYYPFNGNANDESGNGNNGIVNGATPTTDRFGKAGKAYSFDGNDMIELPFSTSLNTNDFTISVWAYHNGNCTSEYCFPIAKGSNGDNDYLVIYKNSVGLSSSSSSFYLQTKNAISINQWYHYFVVRKDNITSFYLNGVLQASNSTIVNISNNYKWIIGSQNNPVSTHYLAGKIDDIRIYNRALSSNEVTELYNSEKPVTEINSNLIAFYPLNGNAKDCIGSGNDGTANGATLTTDRYGNADKAYSFDGVNDYIEIPFNRALLPNNDSKTYQFWIKFNSASSNNMFTIGNGDADYSGGQFRFDLNANGTLLLLLHSYWGFGGPYVADYMCHKIENFNPEIYHLVTATVDIRTVKYYLDGNLIATKVWNLGYQPFNPSFNIQIGRYYNSASGGYVSSFNGILDEAKIYNRSLVSNEITQIYNSEKPNINLTSNNIAIGKTAIASMSHPTTNENNIIDGDYNTAWNAGAYAPQWVSIDLKKKCSIQKIKLYTCQNPAGDGSYEISITNNGLDWTTIDAFTAYTSDKNVIERNYNSMLENVTGVRITTVNSPSWIAWFEIEIFGKEIN